MKRNSKSHQGILFLSKPLLVLLFVLISSVTVSAKNHYVSKIGADSNDGGLNSPFRTLSKAAATAQAGDSVFIRGGIYRERLVVRNSGRPDNYITFQNYAQESVVVDAAGLRQGVMLYGVSYVRIEGLQIRNSTHAGIHIHHHMDRKNNGSDHNIIKGNSVVHCGGAGYSGIYIGGHHNQVIDNVCIGNGRVDGAKPRDHGIYLLGNFNRVVGNYVAYNARVGIRLEGESNLVHANILLSNGESGIAVWVDKPLKGEGITISKNIVINNPKYGIVINGAGSGEKPSDIRIYNNTVVSVSSQEGIRVVNGATAIKVKNNIVKGSFLKAILEIDRKSTQNYEESNNIFYGKGVFIYNGNRFDDLQSYQLLSLRGQGSFSEDPGLRADLSLCENSIARENGVDVGIPFEGRRPSIGALGGDDAGISPAAQAVILAEHDVHL